MEPLESVSYYQKTRLWSGNMWMMCLSHLFLSIAMYMLVAVLPAWLADKYSLSYSEAGAIVAVSGISIFLLGPFFNYWVDRYPRKSVCIWAMILVALSIVGLYVATTVAAVLTCRIFQGMVQGVALMASGSTLSIDLVPSCRRTESNESFAWFGRLGLSLGPLAGLLLLKYFGVQTVFLVAAVLCLLAAFSIIWLKVPFRAPLCPPICSLDRFWLPNGWLMFIQVLPVAVSTGILLGTIHSYKFYGLLIVGFCISLVALRFAFDTADIRSEVVSGVILWGAGLLLLMFRDSDSSFYASATLIGIGLGLITSRLLKFYIDLSRHCERGSANTSYMLSWELGFAIGLAVGCGVGQAHSPLLIGLVMMIFFLLLYLGVTHRWYLKRRVRF